MGQDRRARFLLSVHLGVSGMTKMYHYTVSHPKYGTVKVQAADAIGAVREAATAWGVTRWTEIARACEWKRWSAVSEKKKERK